MRSKLHDLEVIYHKATPTSFCVRADEASTEDIWIAKRDCELVARDEDFGLVRGQIATLTADEDLLTELGLV